MEVIKWTYWDDEEYPEAPYDPETDPVYEEAIIRKIREKGYRFPGPFHQHHPYTVPVMSDGTKYQCSFRHWGDIMARALGLEGPHAYVTWAFSIPPDEDAILPSPADWGEEESEEHIRRYEQKEEQSFEP